ncbi:hypothetical protein [Actinoallomurus acaciae]|uniref:Uncharacterized protein n=1 Tax=Actinoallomurus acaciae TaxID=502577 RepID=A0ABV5YCB6_9ACTN
MMVTGGLAYVVTRPKPVTISGAFTIIDGVSGGKECQGDDGYDDIHAGTDVVVHDASGKTIATGRLEDGVGEQMVADVALRCRFDFTVHDVPPQKFHGIEVSHRGIVTFTSAQVAKEPIELTLGDHG